MSTSPSHRRILVFRLQEGAWGRESGREAILSAAWEAMGCWWWPTRAKRTGQPVLCGQLLSIPALFILTAAQGHLGKPNHRFLGASTGTEGLQAQHEAVEEDSREKTQG